MLPDGRMECLIVGISDNGWKNMISVLYPPLQYVKGIYKQESRNQNMPYLS